MMHTSKVTFENDNNSKLMNKTTSSEAKTHSSDIVPDNPILSDIVTERLETFILLMEDIKNVVKEDIIEESVGARKSGSSKRINQL